ncbi:ankyrin repeat domain-containing protein SOWAHC [Neosynchiropus ocellatus]
MDRSGSGPDAGHADAHSSRTLDLVVERPPRLAPPPPQRRPRQQLEVSADRGAPVTPTMRKKHFKESILNNGLNSVLTSSQSGGASEPDTNWALHPMEHAWMLASVEGSYDSIMQFISEDPGLMTRKDFISGYSVLHWLAKRGQDETLLRVLRYAQEMGIPAGVEVRGSGGLTPLHVASMHGRYSVVKVLVGAFGASVDVMDHNGKRAWQYLREDAPLDIKELLGTWDDAHHAAGAGDTSSSSGVPEVMVGPKEPEEEAAADRGAFDRARRAGSWRFGSLRKIINSLR